MVRAQGIQASLELRCRLEREIKEHFLSLMLIGKDLGTSIDMDERSRLVERRSEIEHMIGLKQLTVRRCEDRLQSGQGCF